MAKIPAVNENQLVIPSHAEVVSLGEYTALDPEQRVSLARLITVVRDTVTFNGEPGVQDYFHAEPTYLETGLYIPTTDDRFYSAQHVVRVGAGRGNRDDDPTTSAVAFQPQEYGVVARSPRDLSRHAVNKTRGAHWHDADQKAAKATAERSAGHQLVSMMDGKKLLAGRIQQELGTFREVYADLVKPVRTRYKVKNIEVRRAFVDERIHDAVDVAALNLDLDTVAVDGIHKVVKKRLYGPNVSMPETKFHWMRYIQMVAKHDKAKLMKLELSYRECAKELARYQLALDATVAQQETGRLA